MSVTARRQNQAIASQNPIKHLSHSRKEMEATFIILCNLVYDDIDPLIVKKGMEIIDGDCSMINKIQYLRELLEKRNPTLVECPNNVNQILQEDSK